MLTRLPWEYVLTFPLRMDYHKKNRTDGKEVCIMGLLDFLKKNHQTPKEQDIPAAPEPAEEPAPNAAVEEPAPAATVETPEQTAEPTEPDPVPERPILSVEQVEALQEAVNRTYPGLSVLVRDVDLTYEQAAKYEVGQILVEKAHVDASCRVMGMVTSHRFAILSNHMEKPTAKELELGPNWGLRVALPGSHFKVLGKHTYQGKSVIFLLHLPEEGWELFRDAVIDLDAELIRKCIARFEAKCMKPPVPDLMMPDWIERCAFPIGMDHQGNFFPVETSAPEGTADA